MSNKITFQDGSVNWAARILLNAAEPILRSADIDQALMQSETDANTLRELIVANASNLILSGQTDPIFVAKLALPTLVTKWRRNSAIIILFLVIVSVFAHFTASYVAALVIITIITLFIYTVIFSARLPLEPTQPTLAALQREVVGPYLREEINRILAEQPHIDSMRVTRAPGLDELSDLEQLTTTDTMSRLFGLSRTMSAGSIGISGPRGVGKTTLLRAFCDPSLGAETGRYRSLANSQDLRIMVAAPVEYSTRDFIMHLFSKLCETVIDSNQATGHASVFSIPNRRAKKYSPLLLGCLLAALGIGLVALALLKSKHVPKLTAHDMYLAVGSSSIAAGTIILAWQLKSFISSRRFTGKNGKIIDEASAWLIRIRYMQTLTMGYGGSMKVPGGPELNMTTTQQLAELQLTLPDLVDRYKEFALQVLLSRSRVLLSATNIFQARQEEMERRTSIMQRRADVLLKIYAALSKIKIIPRLAPLAKDLSEELKSGLAENLKSVSQAHHGSASDDPAMGDSYSGPRLVVGIDEIDKMSAEAAERFLGDIKAIFGIPHCIYLVSVSDEALAMFEQRVLLGRTAFDSTFDEVIRARELNFLVCRYLLRQRIAGIPDSLIAFSQVMSGGLPRDLIRVARAVVEACAWGETQIVELVMSVVNTEINTLKKSFVVEMGESDHHVPSAGVTEYLLKDDRAENLTQALLTIIETRITDTNHGLSFCTALYFYGTVAEIFGGKLANTSNSLRGYSTDDETSIDRLAQARNMISVNSHVAWELISRFRNANDLRTLELPKHSSPGPQS